MAAGVARDSGLAADVIGVAFAVAIGVGNAVAGGSAAVDAPEIACVAEFAAGVLELTALAAAV